MADLEHYKAKLNAQLDEWKADLDKLKAKADGKSADAKQELNESIDALEAKLAQGRSKLEELKGASAEAFESLKDGANSAWDNTKPAYGANSGS